jgi:hypothetical protein
MMSRLYLFPLCSVTRAVWSSVRLDTHVDKVPAGTLRSAFGYVPRRQATVMRVCERQSSGMSIGVPDQVRFPRCRAFVNSTPVIGLARG